MINTSEKTAEKLFAKKSGETIVFDAIRDNKEKGIKAKDLCNKLKNML